MNKTKNHYIKYKRAELENYIKNPESCVKKINCIERLRFAPNIVGDFKDSIMRILSRKIGKYDLKMQGVVLDFRNTKILNNHSDIRNDSAYSLINIESNFYIFSPRVDAIVDGIVKHINHQSMETIISVVIYRVFNVKVIFKGCINHLHNNQEIKIRIKQFHFDNEIPFIEGEMIGSKKKLFDDIVDSGISESSITLETNNHDESDNDSYLNKSASQMRIKERESSSEPSSSSSVTRTKSNKRKAISPDSSFVEPKLKKIKQELLSDDDFGTQIITSIKKEKPDNDESSKQKNKSEIVTDKNESSSKKSKKKKKKKNIDDDFNSTLQLLLNSSNIKTENDDD